jgi:putative chitinase
MKVDAAWQLPAHFPIEITLPILLQSFPGVSFEKALAFSSPMNIYLSRYRIDSIRRISALFGQLAVESGNLMVIEENLRYSSVERLVDTFGSKALANTDPAGLVRQPEALANWVYAGKGGNGDAASGDGRRYRGRGLIQPTLKDNYKAFAQHSGIDVVAQPDLVLLPSYATWSACWYWQQNDLNRLADVPDLSELTRRVNRARHGLAKRIEATRRSADVLRRHWLGRDWW